MSGGSGPEGTAQLKTVVSGRKGTIYKSRPGEKIPEGAIHIDKTLYGQHRFTAIESQPFSQSWPIYTSYYIGGWTALTSAIFSYCLRFKMRLFSSGGRMTCYGIGAMGIGFQTAAGHEFLIADKYRSGLEPKCELCLPTRAAALNIFTGYIQSFGVQIVITSHIARRLYTVYMPPINKPRLLLPELNKLTRSLRPFIAVTGILSAVVPFTLVYFHDQKMRDFTRQEQINIMREQLEDPFTEDEQSSEANDR